MPDEPPRLSYGVRDASEIAERLHRDLAARGFHVWQDVSRLRVGRSWDEDVPEGLVKFQQRYQKRHRNCAGKAF